METEALRQRLNSALEFEDWQYKNDYKSVSVLVLYWQEGDISAFEDEARRIGELFRNEFHYSVEYFAIPFKDSHRRLDMKINTFLDDHGDPHHLMIIHYGGHGDPDDENSREKLAVWAAQSQGGPTVDWSIIQPKLGHVSAEILLILDCCFAAQAARTNQNRAIPSNVELLAACAMGVKTILPGPQSFTTQLIKHLRAALHTTGQAKISDIVNILAHRDSGCRQTPVHFSGLGDGKATICLEPFETAKSDSLVKQEAAWLTLKVSLRDMLTDTLISDIIGWLKAHPARKVSKLTVENVVLSTKNLHHFIEDEGRAKSSGPNFDQLPASAKVDILTAWGDFKTILARLATQLRSSPSITGRDTQIHTSHETFESNGPLATLLEVENGLLSLQGVVQRSVMALPDLYGTREALLDALEDTAMQDLGFVPLLKRRLTACFPTQSDFSLKADPIFESALSDPKLFRSLVEQEAQGGRVLVEYKSCNEREPLRLDAIEKWEKRIQILADLLSTRGPLDFHTLRCTRWFREPDNTTFGLVFEYPTGCDGFMSLREIITTAGTSRRPTLGQRFRIAKYIGEALLKWHMSANWVHQGIASHNIFFFKPTSSSYFDYSNPYLCGFDCARPNAASSDGIFVEEFEFNIYRHPGRQGVPSEYHTKYHDLYSYGILLLEIGIWDLIGNCFDAKSRKNLTPHKMLELIKRHARRVGHYMGTAYERAVMRCLNADFGVELDDPVGSRLAKAFENLALKEFDSGVKLE